MIGSSQSRSYISGGGEMGQRIRAYDWSTTAIGTPETWPQSLRSTVSMLLPSKAQIVLFWGPEFIVLYNDAYRPVFGAKHPHALGRPGREAWSEIWDSQLGPLLNGVVRTGEAFAARDLLFVLERNGFAEDTYFDVSYDPVRIESGAVGAVYCIVTETTERVVGERRLALLRDLAARNATARAEREACVLAMHTLADRPDIAFALAYLDGELQAATPGAEASLAAASPQLVKTLALPAASGERTGRLVVGINPRRPFDDDYRSFLELVADQVATALTNARAYEAERRRNEALAELDRAKTTFFSNVSHEFRTPLTLMLGPTEEALASERGTLGREDLQLVHRNQLRLLKLVNGLLDFSRIEAGRMTALFQPTDLIQATTDLASMFRSAIERAGLQFTVTCEPIDAPLYVDQRIWEHIVLNLLSNAFKFTFDGGITVAIRDAGGHVELRVTDTGIGIATTDLPQLFQRFHRIESARSRTHEGSGIGLALVAELVRLHGGTIAVDSEPGAGTTFAVALRKGSAHLPAGSIGAASPMAVSRTATTIAQEASRWIGVAEERRDGIAPDPARPATARVLIADDNADMREYLARLLQPHWQVEAVADGAAALAAAIERRPDVILADVMMPGLTGLDLVKAVRTDARLGAIPVMLLSARAGEDSRIEGLASGADDYLVKPFSPRELVARVGAQIGMSKSARERIELLRREQDAHRAKDDFLAILGHELRNPLSPIVTALELMRLRNDGADAERAVIERQVAHLSRLVDDLLDVSRITGGKVQLQPRLIEIAEAVEAAVEMTSPMFAARGQVLTVDVPASQLIVSADPTRIAQVISNLLSNASKFSPDGGTISLAGSREDGHVALRVTDQGAGISPAVLPHIFELFVQEKQGLDRRQGGLGLGLAIVRNLVELHGGSVSAESEGAGTGTTFTVRLPLAAATSAAAAGAPRNEKAAVASTRGRRVLIVDDNEDSAEMLATMLEAMGYKTKTAPDSATALQIVSDYTPDVAFLDIGLPVVNGYELAQQLKAIDRLANLRLIAFTGYGQSTDRERARAAGFSFHLVKPLDMAALNEALRPELPA